jgi:hypothetical protein
MCVVYVNNFPISMMVEKSTNNCPLMLLMDMVDTQPFASNWWYSYWPIVLLSPSTWYYQYQYSTVLVLPVLLKDILQFVFYRVFSKLLLEFVPCYKHVFLVIE